MFRIVAAKNMHVMQMMYRISIMVENSQTKNGKSALTQVLFLVTVGKPDGAVQIYTLGVIPYLTINPCRLESAGVV